MKRSGPTSVFPLAPAELSDREYDGFLVALGFESRARNIVERMNPKATSRVAWPFDDRRVLAFDENRRCFRQAGFVETSVADPWPVLRGSRQSLKTLRIGVDLSSMTRLRIAETIVALSRWSSDVPVEIDFWYSMAEFQPPSDIQAANIWSGPIHEEFAGWSAAPDLPVAMVLGLGYEPNNAAGAVLELEPARVLALSPTSGDNRYDESIEVANSLLEKLDPRPRILQYRVDRPFDVFVFLEGYLYSLSQVARPVLVPFGPKVFTLCCLLAAMAHPEAAVWRVTSGALATPSDRSATGEVVGMRVLLGGPVVPPPL